MQQWVLLTPMIIAAVGCAAVGDDVPTAIMPAPVQIVESIPPTPPQEVRELVPGKTAKPVRKRTVTPKTVDAVTLFPFEENRIYPVATSPGFFTSIILEPGEAMPGKAALGDPDPMNWIIEKTVAGSSGGSVVVLLIKPGKAGLKTNIFIPTNRRTYQLDVTSYAKRAQDMVKFTFPPKENNQQLASSAYQMACTGGGGEFAPGMIHRNFVISVASGDKPRWLPVEAFEYGTKTYIAFPSALGQISAPALFTADNSGISVPAPFRVRDNRFYEIDRQFASAELRQGDTIVSIRRNNT